MRRTTGKLLRGIVGVAILAALAAFAIPVIRNATRRDVTDPAVLAQQALTKLRDSELETLVRAAFRNASEVIIEYEGSRGHLPGRHLIITDRQKLDHLAALFAIGADNQQLPRYHYPGMMYTHVEFEGPYQPNFVFTSEKEVLIFSGPNRHVRTPFVKSLADELELPRGDP